MKKIFSIIITFVIIALLSACELEQLPRGEDNNNDNGTPIELATPYTDALILEDSYQGKSFIADGIGEVVLSQCVDGDTARFIEVGGQESFSVRFLGVDTPESTGRIEPWGRAASTFVCDILENAQTIVLQADPDRLRFDNNGRYLGFIWYDGRLLNLELIELAYTHATGAIGLIYGVTMYDAWVATQQTNRRIHGELDPDYDYEAMEELVSIEELVTNTEAYEGKFVTVQGIITRVEGAHPWIQQGDYGIYLYSGFEFTTRLVEGNEVLISRLQVTYYPDKASGALQLTNFRNRYMTILSSGNVVEPKVVTLDTLGEEHIGSLVTIEGLTLTQARSGTIFTLAARDDDFLTINLRKNTPSGFSVPSGLLTSGTRINITGPVHVFNGQIQIVITKLDDIEILD